jgi:ribosomal protein S18 acetylase RimI-like enzyme
MSDITFRNAVKEDLKTLVALLADDDIAEGREQAKGDLLPAYSAAFDEMSKNPDNRILVAERDGEIIGSLQIVYVPGLSRQGAKRAIIESVRVSSKARSQNIGTLLMKEAIAQAKAAGCKLVQLTSDKRRTRAHLFYRRLGFLQTHEGFKLDL